MSLHGLIICSVHRYDPYANGLALSDPKETANALHHGVRIHVEFHKNNPAADSLQVDKGCGNADRGEEDLDRVIRIVEAAHRGVKNFALDIF